MQLVQRITFINYRQLRMTTQRINKYRTFRLNVSPSSQTQYLLNIATNILDIFFINEKRFLVIENVSTENRVHIMKCTSLYTFIGSK